MKTNQFARSLFVLLILALCTPVVSREKEENQGFDREIIKSAQLRSQQVIPLGQKPCIILLEGDAERKKVPVVLVKLEYFCEFLRVGKRGLSDRSSSLFCYEIRSKGDVPYTWAMWSDRGGRGHFRLFTDDQGNNFLAWVEFSSVLFTEVSKPNDRLVELTRYLSQVEPDQFQRVPVGTLVPEVRSWGVNALYFDISVRSIEKDATGKMTLEVSGPKSDMVYTLVQEDEKWHLR